MSTLTALPLTDDDLDALSVVTEADVLRAQHVWTNAVDKRYRNLLLAEEDIDDAERSDDNA